MLDTKEMRKRTKESMEEEATPTSGEKEATPTSGPESPAKAAPRGPLAMPPTIVTPFTFMRRFAEEMDRLFEDFGLDLGLHLPSVLTRGHELLRREVGLMPAEWAPRIDISMRDGMIVVHADLPGLTRDDIKVEVTEDTLTIEGERKHEKREEREGYYYNECGFGRFYRAIPLPEGVDTSKATADFRNGVLEVTMPAPKALKGQARRLEIVEKT